MRGAEPSPSPQGKLVVCHSPSARGLEYDSKSFVDKAHHDLLKCLLTSLFFWKIHTNIQHILVISIFPSHPMLSIFYLTATLRIAEREMQM